MQSEKEKSNKLDKQNINPEYILSLKAPTTNFLCSLQANTYNIQFLAFKIRDFETNQTFFEIERDEESLENEESKVAEEYNEDDLRTIRYYFGPNFFKLKRVGTTLTFSVGDKPVKNFRMIERHYFKDQLIQSFDFCFPFCIPNTTNSWETIYDVPELNPELVKDMISHPWKTRSDSFYFVENDLIMHNKAEYSYAEKLEEY